jgi:uracil-DNA glycosylase family 4
MLSKPTSCDLCPLASKGQGFLRPEGSGSLRVMIVGEAAGEAEAMDGLPFRPYAESGSVLERCWSRLGLARDQFYISNICHCFVSPRTGIFTNTGYRELRSLSVGDQVLTHKSRFKSVRRIFNLPNPGSVYKVSIATNGMGNRPVHVVVTPDHRFLRDTDEWIFAHSLKTGDFVTVLGEYCIECGKPFFRQPSAQYKALPICSTQCHNIHVAQLGKGKLRAIMLESYASGKRDAFQITRAANAAMRAMQERGEWALSNLSPESKEKHRVSGAIAREALGLAGATWIGLGEDKVAALLEAAGHSYTSQYAIEGFNYDFKVGDVIFEIDGPGAKYNTGRRGRQEQKDALAKAKGLHVIHVDYDTPEAVIYHLDNDTHDFPLLDMEVVGIEKRDWNRAVWTLQVEDDESYIGHGTVAHNCRPPGNKLEGQKYEVSAIRHCNQYISKEIRDFKPAVILAVGGVAAKTLTGMSGKRQGIQSIRGFALTSPEYGIPVVPALHPAFLRRGKMSWLGLLISDMQLAKEIARTGVPVPLPTKYLGYPTIGEVESFRDELKRNHDSLLAFDIETNYSMGEDENEIKGDGSQIVLVQFSNCPGRGIALPWSGDYIGLAKEILALPNPKVGHNAWMFDMPRLAAAGAPVAGIVDDSMWAFHHLQPDLPRGLQSVASLYDPAFGPWKHLAGSNLRVYGCKDVDILARIWPVIRRDLEAKDLWRGYEQHVRGLWPILKRMSERGLPLDATKQDEFKLFMEGQIAEVDARLQAAYPLSIRSPHPKLGYAKTPKNLDGLVEREFVVPRKVNAYCHCVNLDTGEIPQHCVLCGGAKCKCRGRGYIKVVDGTQREMRWCKPLPYKASSQQLIRYIRARGHKVPKAIGQDKETTNKLMMERLAKETRDPFYSDNLEYRGLEKMLGSYMWAAGPDGHIHAQFTFSPATGQLAATEPNILTIPSPKGKTKKDELAAAFRATIHAKPGHCMLEVDMSGFHTSTFAYEARDPDYFRLANKLRDPHSFLTAVMLGLAQPDEMMAWDDEKLLTFFSHVKREHKQIRDGQAKPAILGFALGLGANKMYELNRFDPETKAGFKSKRETEALINTLRGLFKRCYQYQNSVRLLAHNQGWLKNRWGYIRWYWDVLHHNMRTGEAELGEQANDAIAFNVQADAHGYLKAAILRMEAQGWLERYNLCNIVHDSVVFECPLALLEEALSNIVAELERPCPVLRDAELCPEGLVVAAEPKVGWSLADMGSPKKFMEGICG